MCSACGVVIHVRSWHNVDTKFLFATGTRCCCCWCFPLRLMYMHYSKPAGFVCVCVCVCAVPAMSVILPRRHIVDMTVFRYNNMRCLVCLPNLRFRGEFFFPPFVVVALRIVLCFVYFFLLLSDTFESSTWARVSRNRNYRYGTMTIQRKTDVDPS